ncbi:pyruvate kinase [Candidatus Falkowbacteria bacterium]|nr:pyruvate kinase [Candidatus Falkowbacteria bacterium]
MKRTKIVCTIGPASDTKVVLKQMIKSGMDVARLNFSHNTHASHLRTIKAIRSAGHECGRSVAILQDLQGPRIRLGDLPSEGIILKNGMRVILTTESKPALKKIPVTYAAMHKEIKAGERVLIADGLIEFKILSVKGRDIHCEVKNGGKIFSHKGINLPDTNVKASSLSAKDKADLLFGIQNNVDFIALSFVRSSGDVVELKELIKKYEFKTCPELVEGLKKKKIYPIKIIVKIERHEAIENLADIIAVSDGVMVARGDLGIEMPTEDVPLLQKMIIDKCLQAAKPVIVATQMLDSMIDNPRPTRAEASDVANAVIDHTDAVMLSGETATGKFPVETVSIMAKIIEKTEESAYDNLVIKEKAEQMAPPNEAVGKLVRVLSDEIDAKLVLAASLSGYTARLISRYRPELPIFVAGNDSRVERQLNLTWGARPFTLHHLKTREEILACAIHYLKKRRLIKKRDKIIVVIGKPGSSALTGVNLVEVVEI